MDALEKLRIEAFARELAKHGDGFSLGADHSDVACRCLHCPAQNAHVVAMAASGDDDIGGLGGNQVLQRLIEVFGDDFACIGETLRVGVRLTIVCNDAVEASVASGFKELNGNVPGAKNVEQRHRHHRFDKDFECPAANQASVVFRILIEVEGEAARLFLRDDLARRLPDLSFHAASANRSGDGAVVPNEHLGALKRRDGAARIYDGGHSAAAALALQLDDLLVNVHLSRLLDRVGAKSNLRVATSF